MPRKIAIELTPSAAEDQLLIQKAAERGIDVDEFATWLVNQSLSRTNAEINHVVKY